MTHYLAASLMLVAALGGAVGASYVGSKQATGIPKGQIDREPPPPTIWKMPH